MERRKFTREFKLEAVKLIQARGVTVAQAARDLGVHGPVLRRWVQECTADAQQARSISYCEGRTFMPEHASQSAFVRFP